MPRSIAENLGLMTHSELMIVIIAQRQEYQKLPPTITDDLWVKWTGQKPRMKRRAIEGLREKGLDIRGSGEKARFYFDLEKWENYVRMRDPEERARVAGHEDRKARPMHPDCVKNGCQKTCESQTCSDTIPTDAASMVVSIRATNKPESAPAHPPPDEAKKSAQNWQPVAKNPPNLLISQERGFKYPLALEALRKYFPWVEKDFLGKLVAECSKRCKSFTDKQLSFAIEKKKNQHSEALFLQTVPGRLRAILEGRIKLPTEPEITSVAPAETLRAHFDARAAELDKAGMPDLSQRLRLLNAESDLDSLDRETESIEREVLFRLRNRTPVSVFKPQIDKELKSYEGKMTLEQLNRLREQAQDRLLFEQAAIGRISVCYAL